MTALAFP
jgi:hypothetical protein